MAACGTAPGWVQVEQRRQPPAIQRHVAVEVQREAGAAAVAGLRLKRLPVQRVGRALPRGARARQPRISERSGVDERSTCPIPFGSVTNPFGPTKALGEAKGREAGSRKPALFQAERVRKR